jgi:tRNA(Ser,Leu) C12 N-acetylase TAN1
MSQPDAIQDADRASKKRKVEGIPVHRGKFKERHTRKHALLLQKSIPGYLVSCDLTSEAQTMSEICTLFPQYTGIPLNIYDSGCSGLVYGGIKQDCDVIECFNRVVSENPKFRFCKRVFPIQETCGVVEEKIRDSLNMLLDNYYSKDIEQGKSFVFSVECRITNCQSMVKQDLIDLVIRLLEKKYSDLKTDQFTPYRVDLSKPKNTIFIALVKSIAMISILPDFKDRFQYNVQKICSC